MLVCLSMHRRTARALVLSWLLLMSLTSIVQAQNIRMGEVVIVSNSPLKAGVKPQALQQYVGELTPVWKKKGVSTYALLADRGDRKGEVLLTCIAEKESDRKALGAGSPFTNKIFPAAGKAKGLSDFLSKPESYTEYRLIGGDKLQSLPVTGMLGIHYIKVKPERADEFEKLVVEKLHPAVAQLLPDMQLLYYKAVAGENKGSYITIFTIASIEARERFWPTGGSEQEVVKETFSPLNDLAKELGTYLVEGSYLAPESGGAAAYWESREWTDFVYQTSN